MAQTYRGKQRASNGRNRRSSNSRRIVAAKPMLHLEAGQRNLMGAVSIAALAGATLATAGAVVMRRPIVKVIRRGLMDAANAGQALGKLGSDIGKLIRRPFGIEPARLLIRAGLRRPPVLKRMLPVAGVVAALVAAAGSALFLVAPRVRELKGKRYFEYGSRPVHQNTDNVGAAVNPSNAEIYSPNNIVDEVIPNAPR
jgi:hypothetical protein